MFQKLFYEAYCEVSIQLFYNDNDNDLCTEETKRE